jgi:hypothetical protein
MGPLFVLAFQFVGVSVFSAPAWLVLWMLYFRVVAKLRLGLGTLLIIIILTPLSAAAIGFSHVVLSFAGWAYLELRDNYYGYPGFGDYSRVPLIPPYELANVDAPEKDWVLECNENLDVACRLPSWFFFDINQIAVAANIVIGRRSDGHYFLYDQRDQAWSDFPDAAVLQEKYLSLSSAPLPPMVHPAKFFDQYWSDHFKFRYVLGYFGLQILVATAIMAAFHLLFRKRLTKRLTPSDALPRDPARNLQRGTGDTNI